MTATLVVQLAREGLFSLDAPLSDPKFAGLFEGKLSPEYQGIRLSDLLSHRSGITGESWPRGVSFVELHRLPGGGREQRAAYLGMILKEPLEYVTGKEFRYSNRNYAILGAIAEHVANKPWEELIRERIFAPLGMTSAGFGAMGTAGKIDQPWQHRAGARDPFPIQPGPLADNPAVIGPGGTVHASIGDWGKFISAHLRGEKGPLVLNLKPSDYLLMHAKPKEGDYAFGWIHAERPWGGGDVLNHAGSNTMNYAVVWMAPRRDFAVLAATNYGGDEAAEGCDDVAGALIGWHEKRRG
jgi:CubicO group peptidase (beta-lactamase class C family)